MRFFLLLAFSGRVLLAILEQERDGGIGDKGGLAGSADADERLQDTQQTCRPGRYCTC